MAHHGSVSSRGRARSSRAGRRIDMVALAVVLIAVFGAVATIATDDSADPGLGYQIIGLTWAFLPVVFTLCGALIVRKQPRNAVGWALILPGLVGGIWALPVVTSETPPATIDVWAWLQLWVDGISWMLFFFPVFHLLLIFPTGRVLTPRWRWVVALEVGMFATLATLAAFSEEIGPSTGDWTVDNPIGVLDAAFFEGFYVLWTVMLIVLTVAVVLAMTLRFRRGNRIEKQQVKWLLLAVSVFGVAYISTAFNSEWQTEAALIDFLLAPSLMGIPIAITIAVTRHRLYEIDRLVSRTVTYSLVAGFIGAFIASVSAVIGTRFQDPIVVAGTTLAAATMFNPIRRRVQTLVDRRFYRSRYDTEKVIAAFGGSLRDEVDADRVISGMVDVVGGTMQPALLSVWVRD